jgi:hypothetical protein
MIIRINSATFQFPLQLVILRILVNHFTLVTEMYAIQDTSSIHFEPKTASKTNVTDDVNQATEESSWHCAFVVESNKDQPDIDSEINSGVYMKAT